MKLEQGTTIIEIAQNSYAKAFISVITKITKTSITSKPAFMATGDDSRRDFTIRDISFVECPEEKATIKRKGDHYTAHYNPGIYDIELPTEEELVIITA